ncbi:MAG: N-6 DNA methylase [Ignavibacteriae bacterium]|nr:N-6 DNA methylase [Ignavibacteriota bacterium]
MQFKNSLIKEYHSNVKKANTELAKKELLKDLLNRIFDKDVDARKIINKMSLGAEKTIFNIPLKDRLKTGSADTQYGKVIIEFERDLNATGEHAKEQLAEYLAGNLFSGETINFTLIASDCINWKIYAPESEEIIFGKEKKVKDIKLRETDKFVLSEKNFAAFPFFLDRYLFKTEKLRATLENISNDFGETSILFIRSIILMKKEFLGFNKNSELSVAYEQWEKYLSIAYGKFKATEEVFLVHTYLSIFSKILAYTVLTKKIYSGDNELKKIIRGDIFNSLNVKNFIDDDFYHWAGNDENFEILKPIFHKITQKLNEYDFSEIEEDILKGLYQELIDLETRHSLGEYYTPDWLCQKIVDSITFKRNSTFLDPACGSGSFLLAISNKLKKEFPDITAEDIAKQVIGIDIHPLSVQISKTTLLLGISDRILKSKKPVFLGVFLANSLLMPEKDIGLFGNKFRLLIDKTHYEIETSIFNEKGNYDNSISLCNDLAEYSLNGEKISLKGFENQLSKSGLLKNYGSDEVASFYRIYEGLKLAKEEKRDAIWKFILQNIYKPFLLSKQFDFVIGNPPWITYSDVTNSAYQEMLYNLAEKYKQIPESKKNMPHLEIAAIFLSHSSSYFLKENGKIVFVLPRSFLSADQHDNSRSGKALGFKIKEVWDLVGVSPLFRIPSCVVFADKSPEEKKENRSIPKSGIEGLSFSGNPFSERLIEDKKGNAYYKNIQSYKNIDILKINWYYSKLGERTAFTNKKIKETDAINFYKDLFKQGATIVPRNFYFVEVDNFIGSNNTIEKNSIITLRTSDLSLRDAKEPWRDFIFNGRANTNYLFKTALAKNILPFVLINPPLVLLPIEISSKEHKKTGSDETEYKINLLNSQKIFDKGDLETAEWFRKAEEIWEGNKTENNKNINLYDYLNWQQKLIQQDLNKKYLVLYTASAKDANAVVISREDFDLGFIVESKAYWFGTNDIREAHYICSFLNCSYTNKIIKDFQSRGLFGARDVHKKILEVPYPQFNKSNQKHLDISELGNICSQKVEKHFGKEFKEDISGINLGNVRLEIREILKKEIKEIDRLIKDI